METNTKMSEKLYERYEYLARKYASKIYSYEELSFEFEDLIQEFKLKIYTSIKSYGRRWSKYKKNEAAKPVPLRYYLEAACANKSRDFMKYISRENYKTRIDDIDFDFGVEDNTHISPEDNQFIVNDVDLLEGLSGKERLVFSLYLRGYNAKFLAKVYFNNAKKKSSDEVNVIIEAQKSFLIQKYGNELRRQRQVYKTYNFDDEE